MSLDAQFWNEERDELYKIMLPLLQSAAIAGAKNALEGLVDEIGMGVDWGLVNTAVQKWASRYAYDLVSEITDTSKEYLQKAVSEWIASGQALDELMTSIAPMFGADRAEMIAVTEVTRAFAEGNKATWEESVVVDGMKWMTAEDEDVCPLCNHMDGVGGLTVRFGEPFKTRKGGEEFDNPPAHVNCRCYLQPVVSVS